VYHGVYIYNWYLLTIRRIRCTVTIGIIQQMCIDTVVSRALPSAHSSFSQTHVQCNPEELTYIHLFAFHICFLLTNERSYIYMSDNYKVNMYATYVHVKCVVYLLIIITRHALCRPKLDVWMCIVDVTKYGYEKNCVCESVCK
jgi:hypothetical protein